MKQLSKAHKADRDKHVAELTEREAAVRSAWDRLTEAHDELTEEIQAYNGALLAVAAWRDEITLEMETYFDERSEKWQEGEAGTAYQEWMGEWQEAELDELEAPELPDEPEFPHADTIEALSEEPNDA